MPFSNPLRPLKKSLRIKKWPSWNQIRHAGHVLSLREKRLVQISLFVGALAVVVFLTQVANAFLMDVPKTGGTYREAVVGSPQLINPLYAPQNDVDMDIAHLVFSGLMRHDASGALVPDIAESYEINKEQTEYTFVLRSPITWHDGTPLTVDDVIFTFSAIQDPLYGSPLRVSFQGVTVSRVNERTVKFTLEKPFAPFLGSLTAGIISGHIWGNIDPRNARLSQFNIKPVGSGPYKFKELLRTDAGTVDRVALSSYENFYRHAPYLSIVEFHFYPSFDMAVQDVKSGQVEGIHFVPKKFKSKVERKHILLRTLQLPQYTALFFNPKQAPELKTKAVREALQLAIDQPALLQDVLHGEGTIINSPILEGFVGYDPAFHTTSFDRERAKKLLDDAGWKEITPEAYREARAKAMRKELETATNTETNTATSTATVPASSTEADAIQAQINAAFEAEMPPSQTTYRAAKDGTPLQLAITTVNDNELVAVAEYVAKAWREVGVQVSLRAVPARDITAEVLRPRLYDSILYGEILGADPDPFPFWHSSQADYPGLNLANFVNRKSDALLEEARQATSDETRTAKYKAFQEILRQEQPAVFLFAPTYTYAVSDKIQGMTTTRVVAPADRFNDIEGWYMETRKVLKK